MDRRSTPAIDPDMASSNKASKFRRLLRHGFFPKTHVKTMRFNTSMKESHDPMELRSTGCVKLLRVSPTYPGGGEAAQ